jgi:hypothetical protein
MAALKEGDRVRIAARTPTEEDSKSGLYYSHYSGLTGIIQKVYSKAEVAVEVEHESLAKEIRKRRDDVRDQMKTKWLDGLSEEGRSKLTEREKDFNLRYVILVAMADLEKAGARPVKESVQASGRSGVQDKTAPAAAGEVPESAPRKTLAELEAAEEAEFLRRAQQKA